MPGPGWPLANALGFAVGDLLGRPIQDSILHGVANDPSTFVITAFAGWVS